jgi:hypothetical protein
VKAPSRPAIRPESSVGGKRASSVRNEHEMAGGIEDWEDIQGEDVDRYGFITARKETDRSGTPEPRSPQRMSTVSTAPGQKIYRSI